MLAGLYEGGACPQVDDHQKSQEAGVSRGLAQQYQSIRTGFFKKVFKEAFIELLNEDNEKLKLFIKECLREHDFSKRNKN